jgi:hypothetical protein
MPNGISLHIGVNYYDEAAYKKKRLSLRELPNCEKDAIAYMAIADRFHFKSAIRLNEGATVSNILFDMKVAARHLEYGDFFFLTFSGHGGLVWDHNGDEEGSHDQAWCLYDRMLVDDDLYEQLKGFRPGVRVLVIADSCHSGTSIKNGNGNERTRSIGPVEARNFPLVKTDEVLASCILLAACQDHQSAYTGNNLNNSLYTFWMLKVLEQYEFCDSYRELHNRIAQHMPPKSIPNLFKFGPGADQFVKKRPFKI